MADALDDIPSVGVIGGGQMAFALLSGWLDASVVQSSDVIVSNPNPARQTYLAECLDVRVTGNNVEVVQGSDIVVLAVKPHFIDTVLEEVRDALGANHLVISIAAGVTIASIEAAVPEGTRVVRIMPNTPCLVGATASAYSLGTHATGADGAQVERLMAAVGVTLPLPERLLNAVTGLSGSGPAYVFMFIEAMADGGVHAGLPRAAARTLAAQTVFGAAKMVLENPRDHTAVLKDQVASPGGTTIAGIAALESGGFRAATMAAVKAGADRADELA